MKLSQLLFCILIFGTIACDQSASKAGKSVEEITTSGSESVADIIRNPISANEPLDTVNVAKIKFEEEFYDFGTVDEEDKVTHTFKFKNTGKVSLVITDAKSSCGCTIPTWPKDPIAPGKSSQIDVKFDTKSKPGRQSKPVTIYANTIPQKTVVYLNGYVTPKGEN